MINQNIRKIGIFRALGASKADIIKMFLFSGMMFALLAFALALSINLVGINVINAHYLSILFENDYIPHAVSYFTYGFRQFGITFGLIFGAFLLSSLIPILKLMKKQPVDIIANRK